MTVGPAPRGLTAAAPGHATVLAVVVHPLVVGVESVVDRADPLRVDRGIGPTRPGRQARRVGALLRLLVERRRQAGERGQVAVDALAVDGHEELLGYRELGEVGRQQHRAQAFCGPGVVDGLQRDPQAGDGGVCADGGADVGIVRRRGHRVRRVRGAAGGRGPAGRAPGQQQGQTHRHRHRHRHRPPRPARVGEVVGASHQVAQRSPASFRSGRAEAGPAARAAPPP